MSTTKICRYCGRVIQKDAENCPYCGRYLYKKPDGTNTQYLVCSKCEATVNTDDNFCQVCGAVYNIPDNNTDIDLPVEHNKNRIHYNVGILIASLAICITYAFLLSSGDNSGIGQIFGLSAAVFAAAELVLYIYFIPSIIAIENNNPNVYLIYILNLLLGITVIGWFVTLVMAMNNNQNK